MSGTEFFQAQYHQMFVAAAMLDHADKPVKFLLLWNESKLKSHFIGTIVPVLDMIRSLIQTAEEPKLLMAGFLASMLKWRETEGRKPENSEVDAAYQYIFTKSVSYILQIHVKDMEGIVIVDHIQSLVFKWFGKQFQAEGGKKKKGDEELGWILRPLIAVESSKILGALVRYNFKSIVQELLRVLNDSIEDRDVSTSFSSYLLAMRYIGVNLSSTDAVEEGEWFLSELHKLFNRVSGTKKKKAMEADMIHFLCLFLGNTAGNDGKLDVSCMNTGIMEFKAAVATIDKKSQSLMNLAMALFSEPNAAVSTYSPYITDVGKMDKSAFVIDALCIVARRMFCIDAVEPAGKLLDILGDAVKKLAASKKAIGLSMEMPVDAFFHTLALYDGHRFLSILSDVLVYDKDNEATPPLLRIAMRHAALAITRCENRQDQKELVQLVATLMLHDHQGVSLPASYAINKVMVVEAPLRAGLVINILEQVGQITDINTAKTLLSEVEALVSLWASCDVESRDPDFDEIAKEVEREVLVLLCSPHSAIKLLCMDILRHLDVVYKRFGPVGGGDKERLMAGIHRVQDECVSALVERKSLYVALGIDFEGVQDLMGLLGSDSENARAIWCLLLGYMCGELSDSCACIKLAGKRLVVALEAIKKKKGGETGLTERELWWRAAAGVVAGSVDRLEDANVILERLPKADDLVRRSCTVALSCMRPPLLIQYLSDEKCASTQGKHVADGLFLVSACLERIYRSSVEEGVSEATQAFKDVAVQYVVDKMMPHVKVLVSGVEKATKDGNDTEGLKGGLYGVYINLAATVEFLGFLMLSPEYAYLEDDVRSNLFHFLQAFEKDKVLAGLLGNVRVRTILQRSYDAQAALMRGKRFSSDVMVTLSWINKRMGDGDEKVAALALNNFMVGNYDVSSLVKSAVNWCFSMDLKTSRIYFTTLVSVAKWCYEEKQQQLYPHAVEIMLLVLYKVVDPAESIRILAIELLELMQLIDKNYAIYYKLAMSSMVRDTLTQYQLQLSDTLAESNPTCNAEFFATVSQRSRKMKGVQQYRLFNLLIPWISRLQLANVEHSVEVLSAMMDMTQEVRKSHPDIATMQWKGLLGVPGNVDIALAYVVSLLDDAEVARGKKKNKSKMYDGVDLKVILNLVPFFVYNKTTRTAAVKYLLSQLTFTTWLEHPNRADNCLLFLGEMVYYARRDMLVDLYYELPSLLMQTFLGLDGQLHHGRTLYTNLIFSPEVDMNAFPHPLTREYVLAEGVAGLVPLALDSLGLDSIATAEETLRQRWAGVALEWYRQSCEGKLLRFAQRSLEVYRALMHEVSAEDVMIVGRPIAALFQLGQKGKKKKVSKENSDAVTAVVLEILRTFQAMSSQASNDALVLLFWHGLTFLRSHRSVALVEAVKLLKVLSDQVQEMELAEERKVMMKMVMTNFHADLGELIVRLLLVEDPFPLLLMVGGFITLLKETEQLTVSTRIGIMMLYVPYLRASYSPKSADDPSYQQNVVHFATICAQVSVNKKLSAAFLRYVTSSYTNADAFSAQVAKAFAMQYLPQHANYVFSMLGHLSTRDAEYRSAILLVLCSLMPYVSGYREGPEGKGKKGKQKGANEFAWVLAVGQSITIGRVWTAADTTVLLDSLQAQLSTVKRAKSKVYDAQLCQVDGINGGVDDQCVLDMMRGIEGLREEIFNDGDREEDEVPVPEPAPERVPLETPFEDGDYDDRDVDYEGSGLSRE